MKKILKRTLVILLSSALVITLTGCDTLDNIYDSFFDFLFKDVLKIEAFMDNDDRDETQPSEGNDPTESSDPAADNDHSEYALPEYTGYDEQDMLDLCEELSALAEGSDFDAVTECYEAVLDEYDKVYDQDLLSYIEYCNDTSDDAAYEAYNDMEAILNRCLDAAIMSMKDVLNGPMGDEFTSYVGEDCAAAIEEYQELSDQEEQWNQEINDLVNEYHNISSEYSSNSLTLEEYNAQAGAVYIQLVQIYDAQAEYYGYENYSEYADEMYARDFTEEDLDNIHTMVREFSDDYYYLLYNTLAYFGSYLNPITFTADELIETVEEYAADISPLISETLDVMTANSLFNINSGDNRFEGSFSTSFSSGAPFTFIHLNGWNDFSTITHELGHDVQFYTGAETASTLWDDLTLDVAEVHSNSLMALYMNFYDDIYGSYSSTAYSSTLMDLFTNIVDGSLLDEFQRTIYENPNMTLEEINAYYAQLCAEYGMPEEYISEYNWVAVPHNFLSPLYYLSYCASGMAAMQIWEISTEDFEEAVTIWENLVQAEPGQYYKDVLTDCGLEPFTEGNDASEACEKAIETIESMQAFSFP